MYRRNSNMNSSSRRCGVRRLNCSAFAGMDLGQIEQELEDNIYMAFQEITDTNMNIFETFSDVYVQAGVKARGTESNVVVELYITPGAGLKPVHCCGAIREDDAPVDIYNQCKYVVEDALAEIKSNMESVFFDYFDANIGSKSSELVEAVVIPGDSYRTWEIDATVEYAEDKYQAYTVRVSPDRTAIEDAAAGVIVACK